MPATTPPPQGMFGKLLFKAMQRRAAAGRPTPLADQLGWNLNPAQPAKVADTGVMPPHTLKGGLLGGLRQKEPGGTGPMPPPPVPTPPPAAADRPPRQRRRMVWNGARGQFELEVY